MNAQKKIETVMKELVVLYDFESIKVKSICEMAGVSRKTFYIYYKDKFDVIDSIFYNDIFLYCIQLYDLVGNINDATSIILEKAYQKIYEDKAFYTNALKIIGNNSLEDSIMYHLKRFNCKVLENKNIDSYEKEFLSHYFSSCQMTVLKKWVQDGMVISPKKLAFIHQQLVNDSFFKKLFY